MPTFISRSTGPIERLVGLGAEVLDRQESLTVMGDPEGNVFCVEN
jgi:hypothetical protein